MMVYLQYVHFFYREGGAGFKVIVFFYFIVYFWYLLLELGGVHLPRGLPQIRGSKLLFKCSSFCR